MNVRIITAAEPEWPEVLAGSSAPKQLWVSGPGSLGGLLRRSVAVVGCRAASGEGEAFAAAVAAGLAAEGITVVTDGGHGVGVAALRGAMLGPQVVVSACWAERLYPRGNAQEIRAAGATVVSATDGVMSRTSLRRRAQLIGQMCSAVVTVDTSRRGFDQVALDAARDRRVPVIAGLHDGRLVDIYGTRELVASGAAVAAESAMQVVEMLTSKVPA